MNAPRLPLRISVAVLLAAAPFGLGRPAAAWPRVVPDDSIANRYAGARVGDWATYRSDAAASWDLSKRTVVGKTADTVTIREEKVGSRSDPVEMVIDLVSPPARTSTREELLGSGQETIVVAGTRYACDWKKIKWTTPGRASLVSPAAPTVVVGKFWVCKDVPVGGAVRAEIEIGGRTVTSELTGFGRGK